MSILKETIQFEISRKDFNKQDQVIIEKSLRSRISLTIRKASNSLIRAIDNINESD